MIWERKLTVKELEKENKFYNYDIILLAEILRNKFEIEVGGKIGFDIEIIKVDSQLKDEMWITSVEYEPIKIPIEERLAIGL